MGGSIVDGVYNTLVGHDWLVPFDIDYCNHITNPIYQVSLLNESAELLKQIELLMKEFSIFSSMNWVLFLTLLWMFLLTSMLHPYFVKRVRCPMRYRTQSILKWIVW